MSESTPGMVVSGGVRYRAEDAERLGLKPDPAGPAPRTPAEVGAEALVEAEALVAAAKVTAADIVGKAEAEAADIVAAAKAKTAKEDNDGGAASSEGSGPGNDGEAASDGPKGRTGAKAGK